MNCALWVYYEILGFFFFQCFFKEGDEGFRFWWFQPPFLRVGLCFANFHSLGVCLRRGVTQPQRSRYAQDLKIEDGTGRLSTEALGVMQKSPGAECEKKVDVMNNGFARTDQQIVRTGKDIMSLSSDCGGLKTRGSNILPQFLKFLDGISSRIHTQFKNNTEGPPEN